MNHQAMQRTLPTSTSYTASVPRVSIQRLHRQPAAGTARSPQSTICSAYRQQKCGPRYGTRWGPFFNQMAGGPSAAQVEDMVREFTRTFVSPYMNNTSGVPVGNLPVDIEEQEGQYLLIADIPGLQKSDLKISINPAEQTLKISGERQRTENSSMDSESQPRYRKQYERSMGKFSRTLSSLPKDADLSAVSARVDKGVLTVSIQKKDLAKDDAEVRIDID